MNKPIGLPYGFADATVVRYERSDEEFVVEVALWNETKVVLHFSGALSVLDRGVGDISDIVEAGEGDLFDIAVAYHYEAIPERERRPRLFQFLNVDGNPALEVVAMGVTPAPKS